MFKAMTQAEIWLQDTIGKPLGITDLANHLGYSDSQVRRQFRECFHISPSAYRDQRRIERAAVLLALTPKNIAQVARECGYYNHSSFSRAFHKYFAKSPRHFRQVLRQALHQERPPNELITRIVNKPQRQMILQRHYNASEQFNDLGTSTLHAKPLGSIATNFEHAIPSIALPDLLTEKIDAHVIQSPPAQRRTDVGLYLTPQSDLSLTPSLPTPYRRVTLAPQYYAVTCFDELSALSRALVHALCHLTCTATPFYISGSAPYVLWRKTTLELRVPLTR
ncbi:helix-turn-helix transcriptional regulator [Halomonas vilamensis]|uniref:Helix-turn-helix transcriptional regulator n=1 Tax=Vreelandella vilamensis TaxID=531309 RepID=A0ABU1H2C6_9GAMM|nr:helix-turn-helix transcriptional regulator [Halomonas vilamensis]MDR5898448.1 helix-turn-helix transcriptional regulator [Halomonas vilamensis]